MTLNGMNFFPHLYLLVKCYAISPVKGNFISQYFVAIDSRDTLLLWF